MAPQETPATVPAPVLLFDGECGLCQRLVRVLLRCDRRGTLRFAPLQSPPAQAFLSAHGLPTQDFDSLVFAPDWSRAAASPYLLRTDGALAAMRACGGVLAAAARVLALAPGSWRNAAYRLIARWRHRLFGPWQPQPLARASWTERLLA